MNNAKKQRKTVEWERWEISLQEHRDLKGIFHPRMGMIKDRNSKDLTEAEDIKKRWQEYTIYRIQKNYTKMVLMIRITEMVWSLT